MESFAVGSLPNNVTWNRTEQQLRDLAKVAKMYFEQIMQPSYNSYSCARFFETVIKNFNSEEQQMKKTTLIYFQVI